MRYSHTLGVRRLLCAALTVLIVGGRPARAAAADAVSAAALKAAFLLNFAKFTKWPADALGPGQRLTMCVIGDAAVAEALRQTAKGHSIDEHELTVSVVKTGESTAVCHLVYLSASEIKRSAASIASWKSASLLTVSDAEHFAESSGVAQLIIDNDRMRFAINVGAAERCHVRISSKLLTFATIVKDGT